MSISDAYVRVTCDKCDYDETEVELTALAMRESYDMRNVRKQLTRDGWKVDGDSTICPECCAEDEEGGTG
jgi:hypothetical protein